MVWGLEFRGLGYRLLKLGIGDPTSQVLELRLNLPISYIRFRIEGWRTSILGFGMQLLVSYYIASRVARFDFVVIHPKTRVLT